ncbi:Glutathione S-transferase 1 [Aphelenchoides avenae]|nr:Glutathione S-transferase 1 [Aphelenchus avenae]
MVHYKLVYFDVRGRAEPIRMLLHHEGMEFEDVRFPGDQWPAYKPDAPFGKAPWLEVDGRKLAETDAICRYLARKFGLAGKGEWEQAWVDAIADSFKDFCKDFGEYVDVVAGRTEGDKDKIKSEVFEPAIKRLLPQIESFLTNSGSGFLVKSGYTWVDFQIADVLTTTENIVPGSISAGSAEVKAYIGRVYSIPKIKGYIASRKVTRW